MNDHALRDESPHPASARTLSTALRSTIQRFGSQPAIVHDTGWLSYADLGDITTRIGHAVRTLSCSNTPTVAILGENRLEHTLAHIATVLCSGVVTSINWRLSEQEFADAMDTARPNVLFVSERFLGLSQPWRLEHPDVPVVLLAGESERHATMTTFWELVATGLTTELTDLPKPESIATVSFTSGSSGRPKAAAVSHRALLARAYLCAAELQFTAGEMFIAWPQMSHMASADYTLVQLVVGGVTAVVDGFDVTRIVELLCEYEVGWCMVMPGSYEQLLAELDRRGALRSTRIVGGMADMVQPELIARVTTAMGARFFNSFGSTEAGPLPGCGLGNLIPVGVAPSSLRKTQSAFCDVRIVREDGTECSVEEPGEMLLRGPTLFSGYWGSDEPVFNEDGWFHTGDMLVRHTDGTLDYVDRIKYMIKSGGENIYPAEIERVLVERADVAEAVVVKSIDDKWGERPVAFVVVEPGHSVTGQELIEHVGSRLARFKMPRSVEFIDAADLPRNITGKVIRRELEERVSGQSA